MLHTDVTKKIGLWELMLNIIKCFFYISMSFVVLSSYFSFTSHFNNLETNKKEKSLFLKNYYSNEFESGYRLMSSSITNFVPIGEENFKKALENAVSDGLGRAEIEVMCTEAFKKVQASRMSEK
jgi:hypothetical protein